MNITYNNVDITDHCDVKQADIIDNASSKADSLELKIVDTEGKWSTWNPQKGDTLEVSQNGFSSGIMYLDEIWQIRRGFHLRAIAIPLKSKITKFRSWENIQFLKVAQDLVQGIGLTLKTYNIQNYTYDRLDQTGESNIEFLNNLCIREGYALKITNNIAIIYDEGTFEQKAPVKTIYESDFIGDYAFKSISSGLKQKSLLKYMKPDGTIIKSEFSCDTIGGILKIHGRVSNQAEADRFAKNYLRHNNKFETTGCIVIKKDTSLAAGNVVEVADLGLNDGLYFTESITHRFASDYSILNLRKLLEEF